jgi:CheY-like chemotaxis protein
VLPVAMGTSGTMRSEAKPVARASRRLLIVDDEAAVGRSLQMLLAPDHDVVAVVRAEDALDQIAGDQTFDAILCDLMMPHSSGMQLYEQIAQRAPQYLGRMIFMTGGAFTTQARAFLAQLDRPHLEKPFSERELLEAIASVAR